MAGKKGKSGGLREPKGGRPKIKKTISETAKGNWVDAAKKLKKEHGVTIEYAALEMIFDPKVQGSVKASILKAYNEALIIKESDTKIDINQPQGPTFYIPKRDPDPALEVVKED